MKQPQVGQSVFVPFVTKTNEETGKVERLDGCSVIPFDKIDAVYSDTDRTKTGKPVFSVRLKSGDAVRIIDKDDKWQAVA